MFDNGVFDCVVDRKQELTADGKQGVTALGAALTSRATLPFSTCSGRSHCIALHGSWCLSLPLLVFKCSERVASKGRLLHICFDSCRMWLVQAGVLFRHCGFCVSSERSGWLVSYQREAGIGLVAKCAVTCSAAQSCRSALLLVGWFPMGLAVCLRAPLSWVWVAPCWGPSDARR